MTSPTIDSSSPFAPKAAQPKAVQPKHSRLRTALRVIAYIVLALVVLVVNVVAGGLLYVKSNRGRETILRYGLKKMQPAFPGGVTLASSEGDLTKGLILHNFVINDLDGRPAVMVDRLEVKYSLLALLATRVQVDLVKVDGATIVSQPLDDGRDNLATMADVKMPKPPKHLPISVVLANLEMQARFVMVPADGDIDNAPRDTDIRAVVQARATLSHGMVAGLDQLTVDVLTPAKAKITAQGAAHIVDKIDVRNVVVRVEGDTTELRRRVDKMELKGPVTVVVNADGPIDHLTASVAADTTSPKVRVRANALLLAKSVDLKQLAVTSPFANVDADGVYYFDQTGHGKVKVDASDLSPLALFGAPKMGGSVHLDADIKRDVDHLVAHADGEVDRFRIEKNKIGKVSLHAKLNDFDAQAKVDATDLSLGGIELRTVKVDANGSKTSVKAAVEAHGPEGLDLSLAVAAVPKMVKDQVLGFEASLERMRLRAGGSPWQEDHPAHISADFQTKTFALSPLGLSNNGQHLTVEGRVMGDLIEDVHFKLEHFDLSQLPALLSPGHALPHTDLSAQAEAHGTMAKPVVGVSFEGKGDGRTNHDLIRFSVSGQGKLDGGRADGKVFATIGGQKVSAGISIPLPLKPNQPIEGSVNASVLLNPWFADLLVPKAISSEPILLYTMGAKVTAQGELSGTTSDPKVNASLRVARWGADAAHGNFAVSVEYEKRKLKASSTTTFSSLPEGGGSAAGIIEATAEMPVNLAPALSGTKGEAFDKSAPWSAAVNLKHIDIVRMPFEALAIVPLVQHGTVDGSMQLAGSYNHPKASMNIEGKGLDVNGVTGVGLTGKGNLDGIATTGNFDFTVRGSDALHVKGSIDGNGRTWRNAPLAVSIETPGFDLTKQQILTKVDGIAKGSAEITGTWAHPNATAKLDIAGLKSGKTSFNKMIANFTVKNGQVVASLDAVENGGSIVAKGTVPLRGGTMTGNIDANHFVIDVDSELLPRVRSLRGEVDGKMQVAGTTQKPSLSGKLKVTHGEAVLASTAITYRDLSTTLEFDDNGFAVSGLTMAAGTGGTLEGDGKVAFANSRAESLSGKIVLHRYPLEWDTTTGIGDASLVLVGHRDHKAGGFATEVTVADARVDLQDDHALRGLIPTAHLEDVKVGKARPAAVTNPVDKPKLRPRDGKHDSIVIKGPLVVHGPELDVTAKVDVYVDLGSEIPTADGLLAFAPHGVVRLFGNDYDLERGKVMFGNSAQPNLDFRLSRKDVRARIGVDLGGTARQPTTVFWSNPAVYDASAVAGLITGQGHDKNGVDKVGLEKKVAGPISNLIAVSFRQSHPDTDKVEVGQPQPQPKAVLKQ